MSAASLLSVHDRHALHDMGAQTLAVCDQQHDQRKQTSMILKRNASLKTYLYWDAQGKAAFPWSLLKKSTQGCQLEQHAGINIWLHSPPRQ